MNARKLQTLFTDYEVIRRVFKAAFFLNLFFVFVVLITGMMFKTYEYWYLIFNSFIFIICPAIAVFSFKRFKAFTEAYRLDESDKAESSWLLYMLISYVVTTLLISGYMVALGDPPLWVIALRF